MLALGAPDCRPLIREIVLVNMAAHYSSKRADWATPIELFLLLDAEFRFTLDAAATDGNAKTPMYFTERDDALTRRWDGVVWVNPPYGRTIGRWVEKAIRSAGIGAVVVMLVPARTDSVWFQQLARHAFEVRLLAGRVTFEGAADPAPFPSAVVVLRSSGVEAGDASAFTMPARHDRSQRWLCMRGAPRDVA